MHPEMMIDNPRQLHQVAFVGLYRVEGATTLGLTVKPFLAVFGANVLHLVYIGIMLFDVLTEVVSSIEQVGLCRKTVNPPALFGLVGLVL